jgi:hypothetical protein
MQLTDFKPKTVPGLYSFAHYEHENGAFIQASARGDLFVFQDEAGKRQEFPTLAALKAHVEGA